MQVFEFHFNPKLRPDLIFDSFCYEPENIYEKKMGSLYMLGTLKNATPQNLHFLDRVAKVIKEKYYRSISLGPEKSLKESLKEANEHLQQAAKKGDVSWMGNFGFGVLAFKNYELNFTKVGPLKIFLIREGQVIDIDQRLKFDEIAPWPLKIFGNVVSGKLEENDLVLVLTKEVFDKLKSENLLGGIVGLSPLNQNTLRDFFNKKQEKLADASGVCLAILLTEALENYRGKKETFALQYKFSMKEVLKPVTNPLFGFIKNLKTPKAKVHRSGFALFKPPNVKFPSLKFPTFKVKLRVPPINPLKKAKVKGQGKIKIFKITKNTILISALVALLALGFFASRIQNEGKTKIYQQQLAELREKTDKAKSYLIIKDANPQAAKEANAILKEVFDEISSIDKIIPTLPRDIAGQFISLKDETLAELSDLNNLEIIDNPELVFNVNSKELIPLRIVAFDKNLYLFNPAAKNIFEINSENEGRIIQIDRKFNFASSISDELFFFAKPNQIMRFKNDNFSIALNLKLPYPDSEFNDFATYKFNLYFLDRNRNEIIKYPYLGNFDFGEAQNWLDSKTQKITGAKSMAVDGSLWILKGDNTIEKYYAGKLQKIIETDFFPYPTDLSLIYAPSALPYLYVLEPSQNRIIIMDKEGRILKQFQSEKFDNLLDFAVDNDGRIIWLLNGQKVFKVSF